ncbi:MAG: hypothetical protein A2516_02815 [Alphaproteobacteria bacterium RIFOXYD12_FULL_60_8]|nr:MAG: hypothetical protein A2516_02815 [Alphaproteobacteria bacterium RIFOXYD12_FULL_60_8]
MENDAALEVLLDLDGEEIHYEGGYIARMKIVRVKATTERPHGISYSLTLHAPSGARLMGYDNAHGAAHRGSRFKPTSVVYDHWHRDEMDEGRPYVFTDAASLMQDFFDEIERVLKEKNK